MTLFVCLNVRRQHLHLKVIVFLELRFYLPNSGPASEVHTHNIYTDTSVSFVLSLYHQRMRILAMYSIRENDTLNRNVNCLVRYVGKHDDQCLCFSEVAILGVHQIFPCRLNRNASRTGSQGSKEFIFLQKTIYSLLHFTRHYCKLTEAFFRI